ncbi:uncharacterized protein LOC107362917 [Tetranychus urticae]|uniref:Uncharacterized protein n=1 Tax=Tetranychus urticae TaxID=32264 RepID=T1KCU4_TETUR|nr:uncharacterized protein LOC107362917 [Tetranychus urticae]
MALQSNLYQISNQNETSSGTCLTKKTIAFVGIGVLVATAICISVIVAVSVTSAKSSSPKTPLALSAYIEKMNLIKDEIKWVGYSSDNFSLTDALAGGTGSNGKSVYVCRAKHLSNNKRDYEVIPGTFDPTNGLCAVPYGEKANDHPEFELLVTKNPSRLFWQEDLQGNLKSGAVSGGQTVYNEELYVTRFQYNGYTVLGKLHLTHNKAAIGPADGIELYRETYDLLCVDDYAL